MIPALLSHCVSQYSVVLPIPPDRVDSQVKLPETLARAVPKRQEEFIGGRFCALQALRQAGWGASELYKIGVGTDGAPLWPQGWIGSITHSQGLASAAVGRISEVRGIGIDSESVMSAGSASEVRGRILTVGELQLYNERWHAEWSEAEFVTLIFSAKETIYKCLRPLESAFFDFQAAQLLELDSKSGFFKFDLKKDIGLGFSAGWSGQGRFALSEGWIHTAMELKSQPKR